MRKRLQVALLVLASVGLIGRAGAAPFDPWKETGIDHKTNAEISLDLPFRDQAGRPVTLREISAGKPVVLVPVLHNCPNICGVTLSGLWQAVEEQSFKPERDFQLVAFGIDPREGPKEASASIDQLLKRFPSLPTGGIFALTGSEQNVHAVTDALGYRYAWDNDIGQYAHDAAIAVLTSDGRLSRWLYGLSPSARDLRLSLAEAGKGKIGNWTDQILLLCYHYDPVNGQYSSIAIALMRGASITMLVVAGGAFALAILREKRKDRSRKGTRT